MSAVIALGIATVLVGLIYWRDRTVQQRRQRLIVLERLHARSAQERRAILDQRAA
jgi:hypothetical protein